MQHEEIAQEAVELLAAELKKRKCLPVPMVMGQTVHFDRQIGMVYAPRNSAEPLSKAIEYMAGHIADYAAKGAFVTTYPALPQGVEASLVAVSDGLALRYVHSFGEDPDGDEVRDAYDVNADERRLIRGQMLTRLDVLCGRVAK